MGLRDLRRATALLALIFASGCTGFWNLGETDGTLEDTMRTYTQLIRWGERERASLFVDVALLPEFTALSPDIERLHFTDFDMGPVEFLPGSADDDDDDGRDAIARVTVVYSAYDVNTLVERRIIETQRWTSTGTNTWTVEPDLSAFRVALGHEPAR